MGVILRRSSGSGLCRGARTRRVEGFDSLFKEVFSGSELINQNRRILPDTVVVLRYLPDLTVSLSNPSCCALSRVPPGGRGRGRPVI